MYLFYLPTKEITMNLSHQFRNLAFIAVSLIAFTACQNNDEPGSFDQTDSQFLEDNATAEFLFEDALALGVAAGNARAAQIDGFGGSGFDENEDEDGGVFGNCAIVTFQNIENVKTVTIDFGTEGCTGFDEKVRKGKVIFTFTARHFVSGSVVTTTFDGYSVDGVGLEGTKTVTNITVEGGNHTHRIVVDAAKLTFPDTKTIEWESNRTREWVQGANTPLNISDDVFHIGGTYSGKNRQDRNYSMTSTTDLEYKASCRRDGFRKPSAGVVEVESSNFPDYTVDFGSGTCDDTYTVTINGQVIVING